MKNAAFALIGILAATALAAPLAGQTEGVVDPDSVVTVQIPAGWAPVDLGNRDASLTFGDPEEDAFLMVIVEDKSDMFGWNLAKMSYVTVAQTVAAMDFPEVEPPTHFQIDGSDAVRWDLRGATSGAQVRFAKIAVDGPTAYIQLIGWTGLSAWDEKGPVVEGILRSATLIQ